MKLNISKVFIGLSFWGVFNTLGCVSLQAQFDRISLKDGTALPNGLARARVSTTHLLFEYNTASTGNFSTKTTMIDAQAGVVDFPTALITITDSGAGPGNVNISHTFGNGFVQTSNDGFLYLKTNSTQGWGISGSSGSYTFAPAGQDNLQDLGTASLRVRNLYLGTGLIMPSTATLGTDGADVTTISRTTNPQTLRIYGNVSSVRYVDLKSEFGSASLANSDNTPIILSTNNGSGQWMVEGSSGGYKLRPQQTGSDIGNATFPAARIYTNSAISSTTLAAPGSPQDGDWWVECSGTSPTRNCSLKTRDTGSTRNIVTSSNF